MFKFHVTSAFLAAFLLAGCSGGSDSAPSPKPGPKPDSELAYPETKAGQDRDTFFGRVVADPYRWLEDIRSQEVDNWIQAQNRFAADYIAELPDYDAVAQRIAPWYAPADPSQKTFHSNAKAGDDARQHIERIDGVQGADGNFYYQKQVYRQGLTDLRPDGGRPEFVSVDNVIYVASSAEAVGQGKVLVNANDFRVDPDDDIALTGHQISPDGNYLVYNLTRNFVDLSEIHVVSLDDPSEPIFIIPNTSGGTLGFHDNGLLYASPRETLDPHVSPHTFQTLYFQAFTGGKPQAWWQAKEFESFGGVFMHKDGYLYITFQSSLQGALARLNPNDLEAGVEMLLDARAQGRGFELRGASPDDPNKLLLATTQGAPFYRLIEVDPDDLAPEHWREILPNSLADAPIYVAEILSCGTDHYARHLDQGSDRLFHYGAGGTSEISLPGLGAVGNMKCAGTETDPLFTYTFSTLVQPAVGYSYDPRTLSNIDGAAESFTGYDPDDYVMQRLFAASADGMQVPIYIAHKKGLAPSGETPGFLYAYGGFFYPLAPGFTDKAIPLLESGGVYAVAQVRGGGEFGNAWYDDGRLLKKQNTYNDLIASAEHLIAQGWVHPGKLAVQGESNGGLTTAAVALQRPDLFAVSFPVVGVHDLVRYDKFSSGYQWHGDYGRTTDQADFENLLAISPVHNVKAQAYAPTYVFTGKADGRVMPAHSYKFAAALQNIASGPSPYLLYAFPKDGHSLDRSQQAYLTYMWTAFFHHTGWPYSGPPK